MTGSVVWWPSLSKPLPFIKISLYYNFILQPLQWPTQWSVLPHTLSHPRQSPLLPGNGLRKLSPFHPCSQRTVSPGRRSMQKKLGLERNHHNTCWCDHQTFLYSVYISMTVVFSNSLPGVHVQCTHARTIVIDDLFQLQVQLKASLRPAGGGC